MLAPLFHRLEEEKKISDVSLDKKLKWYIIRSIAKGTT